MKATLEDILFINIDSEEHDRFLDMFNNKDIITVDNETMEHLLIDEMSGENYKLFLKYIKKNYKSCLDKSAKSLKYSLKARAAGNKLLLEYKHNAHVHENIWKLYSESIALAPVNSEELALAYGNRSYILLHFHKYEDCIKDIDRSIAITKSGALKVKLLCRKMTCLRALNDNQINSTWKAITSHIKNMDKEFRNKQLLELVKQAKRDLTRQSNDPKEMNKNSVSCTSSDVAVKYNEKCGRHLVATRNIEPGEMVMVLKPYVTSINSTKCYAYCSHCLSFSWSSIPCDQCSLCMFCSEKCKEEAWDKYHRVECQIIPHIQFDLVVYYYYQISIRAVIMGIQEAGSIAKLRKKLEKIDISAGRKTKGLNKNEDFHKDSFVSLYNLSNKCKLSFFIRYIKNTCLLLAVIIVSSDLFGRNLKSMKGEDLIKDEDVTFIGVLILKLIIIAASNAGNIDTESCECKKQKSFKHFVENRCCQRGAFLTSLGSIINNDCNPNVGKCFTDDGKVIYYCYQPIKKNSQITVAYFNHFFKDKKETRQKLMKDGGYFTCTCKACIENWPVMQELFSRFQNNSKNPRYKQNILTTKILPKYTELSEIILDENYQPDENVLQQISKDVAEAVKTCIHPSFVPCLLVDVLGLVFNELHCISAYCVPEKCEHL